MKNIQILILLLIIPFVKGQEEHRSTQIRMQARPMPDSVLLRWAPANYEGWNAGNQYGYYVARITIMRNGKLIRNSIPELLTTEPLKPWPLNQWEPFADSDKYMAIAAQAIYGETFSVTAGKNTSFLEIVNKVKEQDSRFSYALFCADQSRTAAQASALWFTDKEVKKNEKYVYRVYLAAPQNIIQSDTAYAYTGTDEYQPLPKPLRFSAEFGNKGVILHWDYKTLSSFYNAYKIERSEDSIHYEPLPSQTLVSVTDENENEPEEMMYIDSLASNDKLYYYRIYGFTAFGEKSPPSSIAKGKGIEDLSFTPEIIQKKEVNGKIELTWSYRGKLSNIKGFRVYRSPKLSIGYDTISPLLKPDVNTFTDTVPLSVNYYKITVFGINGESKSSFPTLMQPIDSTPPSVPSGLVATADTTGKLILRWKANHEPDLLGYRIYRGNAKFEEFSQLTVSAISDTVFIDTINLKTTTRHVYYEVMAIDKRMNHSDLSEPLEVERPDIVPPSSPAITEIVSDEKGIYIQWEPSSSNDVAGHIILRREKSSNQYSVLKQINLPDTLHNYTDTAAQTGVMYYYTVKAKDKSGLLSQAAPERAAMHMADTKPQLLADFKAEADRMQHCINLSWKEPESNVSRYIIYRKTGVNGMLVTYQTIPVAKPFFCDKKVDNDTHYEYVVEAVMINGKHLISNNEKIDY
jgi:uncharacterized protein